MNDSDALGLIGQHKCSLFGGCYTIHPHNEFRHRPTPPNEASGSSRGRLGGCSASSIPFLKWLPHGGGLGLSGQADIGIGNTGAIATGSAGSAAFISDSGMPSAGFFKSGGATAFAGSHIAAAPAQTKVQPFALGAYAGVGEYGFITNAQSPLQIAGPFAQWNANIGFGPSASLSFAYDDQSGIWQLGISKGPGFGLSGTAMTTNTVVSATPGSCN